MESCRKIVNAMAADALAHSVGSAAMVLIMYYNMMVSGL